jgi:arsenate reductase-like glutaredoxin family protein
VLNTRHEIAKSRGWKAAPPAVDEFVAAAGQDNNLLRRPIVLAKNRAVVGFDEASLRAVFG